MRGFGQDDFIPIDESELEAALYAHITGNKAFFNSGSITGSHISAIMPDYHRSMGWNYGYKMQPEDWTEVERAGVRRIYENCMLDAKMRVNEMIRSGRVDLIGKNNTKQLDEGKV